MKNCEYLGKGISSPLMLSGRYIPRQWSCYLQIPMVCPYYTVYYLQIPMVCPYYTVYYLQPPMVCPYYTVYYLQLPMVCPYCAVEFTERSKMNVHIRAKHLRDYTCRLCGKVLGSSTGLKYHIQGAHGDKVVCLVSRMYNPGIVFTKNNQTESINQKTAWLIFGLDQCTQS